MNTYIAFLRGINVSGQKKIPMADLRKALSESFLKEVQTYIQSGNLVFKTDIISKREIEQEIHRIILSAFGFDVPVLVKSVDEAKQIFSKNPYDGKVDIEQNRVYFVLLLSVPEKEAEKNMKEQDYPFEKFTITEDCVYLCCHNGYGKAKLNNNRIEGKLKVKATTRNFRTMNKLLEMATS